MSILNYSATVFARNYRGVVALVPLLVQLIGEAIQHRAFNSDTTTLDARRFKMRQNIRQTRQIDLEAGTRSFHERHSRNVVIGAVLGEKHCH